MMKAKLKPLLRACTAFTCATVLMASPVLVSAGDSVSDLEQETQNLQSELQDLNEQLSSISGEITSLASKIESTNKEAEQAELDLAAAQVNEDLQYQSMKKRIQYIYENGNVSFLEILFTSDSMGEFLNRVDFVERVTDYDRKMLTELQETKNQIAEEEKTLQAQQDSLVSLQTSLDKKQSDLEAKAAATSTDLATFQAQLAALRAQEAAELEAKRQQELQQQQQQKSDKPSSGDGNSTVTPTPPTTPDSGGDIIQGGGSDATHDELTTFAALLDCEAIHDYNSMLAVATVIMNRVESPLFPNSIHGVIYATGQFEPVWSGRLDSVLNSGPSSLALQVAQDAVNGARLSSVIDCYYFLYAGATDRPGVNVGGNLFFQSW